MTNNQNLTQAQVAEIEALTSEQLKAVRLNIQGRDYSDEQTREAVAEYVVDGGSVADLLAAPGHSVYEVLDVDHNGACMRIVKRSDGKVALAADSDVNESTDYDAAVVMAADESNWYASVRALKAAFDRDQL